MKKVSIVITSYNRIDDLQHTILMCGHITYKNIEYIIVDNGSTDGSMEYVEELSKEEYSVYLIPKNMGSAYAHTLGMKKATGDYIITIDDDCFLAPSVVDNTVKIFNYHDNLAAIGYGFLNPNINFDVEKFNTKIKVDFEKDKYHDSYESMVATSGAAFRKSALEDIGYYDLNWFYIGEDVELCMKLIGHGYNSVKISDLVAYHKSSPVNRNFDQIAVLGLKSSIWLKVKFYPLHLALFKILLILFKCIYYTFLYKDLIYIRAVIESTKKINYIWPNRCIIKPNVLKTLATNDANIFTR
jgi:GT2 family glycosyltransferase